MTMTARDEYVAKLKVQLDRWNAQAGRLEAKAKSAREDARKQYAHELESLKDEREKALYKLRLLEGAAESAWSELARGADEAWDRMRTAIDQARVPFEKQPSGGKHK